MLEFKGSEFQDTCSKRSMWSHIVFGDSEPRLFVLRALLAFHDCVIVHAKFDGPPDDEFRVSRGLISDSTTTTTTATAASRPMLLPQGCPKCLSKRSTGLDWVGFAFGKLAIPSLTLFILVLLLCQSLPLLYCCCCWY